MNFSAVVFILGFFGRKPFAAFLQARSENISKEMKEAETLYAETQSLLTKSQQDHSTRESHAKKSFDETKAMFSRLHEKTVSAAKAEAERIQKEAKMMGSNEVQKAKEALQREVAEKSLEMAEEFLGKSLDPKDKHKLVAEYVELVRNGTPR